MAEETLVIKMTPKGEEQTKRAIRTVEMAADGLSKKVITVRFNAEGKEIGRTTRTLSNEMRHLDREVRNTTASFSLLGRIVAVSAISTAVGKIIGLTDAFTNLQNKLSVVNDGVGAVELATERLLGAADRSRMSLESLATVYSRTMRAMDGYGKSSLQVTRFTELLGKAIAVGGSTSVEASNAMIQLSQGMSSGTLRGDELRSVMEQLPFVAKLIAKEFGVTTGELKKLGAEGKLVTDRVFNAIVKGGADIESKFSTMTPTVAQAWEVFKNHALVAMEEFQKSSGKLADGLIYLANNFDLVIRAGLSLAYVIGFALAVRAVQALIAGFMSLAALNPFVAIGASVTLLMGIIAPFVDKIKLTKEGTATLVDLWEAFTLRIQPFKEITRDIDAPFQSMASAMKAVRDAIMVIPSGMASIADIMTNPALQFEGILAAVSALRGDDAQPEHFRQRLINGRMSSLVHSKKEDQDFYLEKLAREAQGRANLREDEERARKVLAEQDTAFARMADRQRVLEERKGKSPAIPGKGTPGRSMEDILRELREGLDIMRNPLEDEMIVQKRIESELDKLGKKQGLTGPQFKQLEDLIRQQEAIRIGKELQLEQEKLINKALDERLEAEMKIIEAEQKISADLGERVSRGRDSVGPAIRSQDEEISRAIDPMITYNEEMQKYEDFVKRHPEKTNAVNNHLAMQTPVIQKLASTFEGLNQSMGDAIGNAVVFGDSLSESLNQIAKSLASAAISNFIQILTMGGTSALGNAIGIKSPPVLGTRVGSGAKGGQFRSGGYTGNVGVGDIAGVVHGREFVVNANATARNRATLESMNAGKAVNPTVTVHNYAGVVVETQGVSAGEVQIMIRKGVAELASTAVSADMRNPNSKISRAIRSNFETRPNR